MKEQLKAFLALESYTTVTSNLPEFLVFLKKEYRHINVIYVIELEEGSTFSQERYRSVYDSACKLLEKNEITEMHILTVLITDCPGHASEVCRDDKYAWIIDRANRTLIIDEDKAVDFYGMKSALEHFLEAPEAASIEIEETKEKVLTELRAKEKELMKAIYVPWAAYILVAINIVVYIVCTSAGSLLYNIGDGSVTDVIDNGQWYRVLTSMFLHRDVTHLFYNMLLLYMLGNMVEQRLGRWKFTLSYLGCGIVAGLMSLGLNYYRGIDVSNVGASGAVYGIFGIALISEIATINWRRVSYFTIRRIVLVLICVGVSLYIDAQTAGIDYVAHVGGLCVGAVIGVIWYFNLLRKKKEKKHEG